jgi:general secretion pathway protein H
MEPMDNPEAQVSMRSLETGMPDKKKGFTLIEVLVVLVIIGITISFALLSFGDFGRSRRILSATENTLTEFKNIRQQAMLESVTYGLNITHNGYKILRLHPPQDWRPASSSFLVKPHPFPEQTVMQFDSQQKNQKPQIIFFSTGEITPFRISFGTTEAPYLFQIIGEANGHLTLKSEHTQ